MKKLIACLLALFVLIPVSSSPSLASNERRVTIYLDGEKVPFSDAEPYINSGRVLVPVRGFFEKIGVTVDWNQTDKIAIIKDDKREIMLELGNRTVLSNGIAEYLDCSVALKNDHAMIPLRYIAESFGYDVEWEPKTFSVHITKGRDKATGTGELPRLKDLETFYQLIHYSDTMRSYLRFDSVRTMPGGLMNSDIASDSALTNEEAAPSLSPSADPGAVQSGSRTAEKSAENTAGTGDYSGTNNQVEGVEEGDVVKTDGKYIYSADKDVLRIINADPANPRVLSEIPCSGGISEIYIYSNKLILINGVSQMNFTVTDSKFRDMAEQISGGRKLESTNVRIYDISDHKKPKLLQDRDYEGNYISSRMIDDNVYIVTNANVYFLRRYIDDEFTDIFCRNDRAGFRRLLNEDPEERDAMLKETGCKSVDELFTAIRAVLENSVTPGYADNLTGKVSKLHLKDIPYFPDMISPNYLITVGIDLNGGQTEVKAYMGSSRELYVSAEHLYTALPAYCYNAVRSRLEGYPCYDYDTTVYKFGLQNGKIAYEAKGKAPGVILDQFSMDENAGIFRIATTTGQWSGNTANNVYTLDEKLAIIGRLENIAEGEKIYSTRFAGDRIYMVTFRQMDPFFVIDAADPKKLSVLGYLKIPGFSTYMHILDDGHVLGFGFDTKETGTGAVRTGGFKLSLFDVTDVSAPKEIKNEVIGQRASSELENDHKALMISIEKGIMGFPVVYTDIKNDYFAGFYIYRLYTDDFEYLGRISHVPAGTAMSDAGEGQFITRGIYIGDYLYTFSRDRLEVHSLQTLKKTGSLAF
ncbi:MAG TPA: beta-propeller domain-containing protein [Clostridia bacterium]|nr:beta-propeller domain-containing protein [Clostridia bacterium]